ncbi:MAG: hypothetical protein U9Q69_05735 [Nanoarchaeota archaeon]|nr:hypothetical protein [Nanoarchaeota archaeon]
MALTTKQKHKLKRFIRTLNKIKGRHTELVSVYIPKGYDLNKIINHLAQEQGTAENIKDKTTRTHVIDSLERMIRHLRLYKKTPDNGLAVFSGDASEREGKADIQVWSLEPPEPINTRVYRCDQSFKLDLLEEMLDTKELYGLIVVDRREGNVGFLKGTNVQEVVKLTSGVPGKTRAGGQCIHPETAVNLDDGQYVKAMELRMGDNVLSYDFSKKEFISSKIKKIWTTKKEKLYNIQVKEILHCSKDHLIFLEDGTTLPAEKLKKGMLIINENGKSRPIETISIENKNIEMVDIEVANKNFIAEGILVHNSAQRFARIREGAAKEFFKRIAAAAQKEFLGNKELKGILVGGPGPTKETFLDGGYLNNELKEKVISIQDLSYTGDFGLKELVTKSKEVLAQESITEEKEVVNEFLTRLAKESKLVAYGKKEVEKGIGLKAIDVLLLSENLDPEYSEKMELNAEESGAKVKIISTDTNEGAQLRDLGGIAALLRYPIN